MSKINIGGGEKHRGYEFGQQLRVCTHNSSADVIRTDEMRVDPDHHSLLWKVTAQDAQGQWKLVRLDAYRKFPEHSPFFKYLISEESSHKKYAATILTVKTYKTYQNTPKLVTPWLYSQNSLQPFLLKDVERSQCRIPANDFALLGIRVVTC